jgi:hypothetical protein
MKCGEIKFTTSRRMRRQQNNNPAPIQKANTGNRGLNGRKTAKLQQEKKHK